MSTKKEEPVYVEAIGRNEGEDLTSHLYIEIGSNNYLPMCRKGWNRSNGASFSILRGHKGKKGLCKTCEKNRDAGRSGVEAKPGSHKTRWL